MRIGEKMSKGIFWFPCFMGTEGELIFTEEIEAILVPCDEDGRFPSLFIPVSITHETAAPIPIRIPGKRSRQAERI